MGAGRKTRTINVQEKSPPPWTVNCSGPARNLKKSDLGGVIFGCKHYTMKECFSKQLFGLPAPHYSYVQNIVPSLPLFLFNYSDRKLHGIFEASSYGSLNIDPCGWTDGNSDSTPYAAQVRFRIQMRCQPLEENYFQPIIAKNYYKPRLFWFELDRHQTNQLIVLFSSSPVTATASASASLQNRTLLKGLPPPSAREEGCGIGTSAANEADLDRGSTWDGLDFAREQQRLETLIDDEEAKKEEQDDVNLKQSSVLSYASVLRGTSTVPHKPRSALSKNETVEDGVASYRADNTNCISSCVSLMPREVIAEDNTHVEDPKVSAWGTMWSELSASELCSVAAKLSLKLEDLKAIQSEQVQKINSLEQDLAESKFENQKLKDRCNMLESSTFAVVRHLGGGESDSYSKLINDNHQKLDKLVVIAGGCDGSSWLSNLDSYSLSEDVMNSLGYMSSPRSYTSAAMLNGEVYIIGGFCGDSWYDTVESYNPVTNKWSSRPSLNHRRGSLASISVNDKIFTLGGANGSECFSEVEMLDPDAGKWIPARSMLHKRFAAAAAEINGMLYVVGGYDGSDYLRSVERFDPREHSWTILGNMSTKRGCLSLAVLNEKLYALGGHDGDGMVSTVEVFDPCVGSWMMEESMNSPRGYAGAAVIEDAIYVLGGLKVDGEMSDVVEYYKVGQGWHATNLKGFGQRCFFSTLTL